MRRKGWAAMRGRSSEEEEMGQPGKRGLGVVLPPRVWGLSLSFLLT